MAIIGTEDFLGAPTSGTVDQAEHPLFVATSNPSATQNITRVTYAASGYTPGYGAIEFDGSVGFSWLQVSMESSDRRRIRAYLKRTGSQTGHNFLFGPSAGATTGSPSAVGSGYDCQIRNTSGSPIWNRYNFVSAGATDGFTADTWWRIEYEFVNDAHPSLSAGALMEVWYDPDDNGDPDITVFAAGAGDATRILFGNTSGASGLTTTWAHFAVSEGERIGPFESTVDPVTFDVSVSGDDATLTWSAPTMPGATHVDIFRRTATGSGDLTPIDPEESTAIARIPVASPRTYTDSNLANGWYAWQVYPVVVS